MKNKQHQRRGGPGTWHRTHMEQQASGCRSLIKSPEFLAIFVWWTDTCVHITDSETICHGECRQFPSKMSWPSWTKSRWKVPKLSSAEVLNIKVLRIWLDFLISIRINHTFNRLIPDYIIYTSLFLIAIYITLYNTRILIDSSSFSWKFTRYRCWSSSRRFGDCARGLGWKWRPCWDAFPVGTGNLEGDLL